MTSLFTLANQVPVQSNGRPYGGARLYFYRTGTTTHQTVYTTIDLDVAHDQPVEADADGVFPPIFINPIADYDYRYQLKTSADVLLDDIDGYPRTGLVAGSGVRYSRTAAESAAGVTPVNYAIPSHDAVGYVIVDRYGTNTTPGTTDMSSAIIAAQKVAFTGNSSSGIGDHAKVKFLRGIYRIETDSIFTQAYGTSGFQRGIVYEGEGLASTRLLLITGGAAKYFYKNTTVDTQKFIFTTFRDLMFVTDSTTYGNGFYFQAEQGYVWERCWFQTMARLLEGNGANTGSEHNFIKCKATEIYDRVISWDNNQMLNICLFGCDFENIYGNCFHVASGGGGRLLVEGGSYILDDGGSKHWLLYIDGAGIAGNNDCYTFNGIQTELHSTNTGLVYKGTPSTSCVVAFNDCNQSSTGGTRVTVDLSSGHVTFNGGRINGSDTYVMRTTGTITWPRAGNPAAIYFNRCGVPVNLSTLITTDTYGYAQARDCHYDEYESGVGNATRYSTDFDLNWDNMGRGLSFPGLKTVCFKIESGDWPYTGDGAANDWTVTLPNNARIKNIYVYRPANGSGGAGNVQLKVGNGDKSTTYGSSTLAAGTSAHYISVENAHNALVSAGTSNPNNQVRIWGDTTNNSVVQGGYAIVQYY